jgi:hypothetical protein
MPTKSTTLALPEGDSFEPAADGVPFPQAAIIMLNAITADNR